MTVGNLRTEASARTLELSQIGAKSNYLEDGALREDRRSLQLFRGITRPLKAALRRPMRVRNIVHGGEGVYDIYYSDSSATFYYDGGELTQPGVANTRFSPATDARAPV
ncbi:MAG: hypothetical protein M3O34_20440 [Chloroflexota bacterium]|nr:hypothetical protein [Chloroflexota bacterium]